ncbi:MAG: RagB/SusD family nutrient uptake outer membrane protein, partial [Muribaculaceae bacterium]|nr:RagB/SusD family nutrient uptake outer membrane protein [Muribaculaceae bacterium]
SQLAPMAAYLSTQAVLAMQARVALWIGDYTTAVTKANEVITSGYYALAQPDDYIDMWDNDYSSEIILMPFMSQPSELSNSIGGRWLTTVDNRAYYVPSYNCLAMYYDDDIRFDSFFAVQKLLVEGSNIPCYSFYKFPGNPALEVSGRNLQNKPKAFRLSEMYLILAEAAYMNNQPSVALKAYNDFCSYRYESWEDETLSGQALLDEIRDERARELIGEGFRMSDLRRWGKGFARSGEYPINPAMEAVFVVTGTKVVYEPNDYRYTWPIPADELSCNPQIKKQQNPGY